MPFVATRRRAYASLVWRLTDGVVWVVAFTGLALLTEATSSDLHHGLRNSMLVGIACGLVYVVVAAPLHLHRGRAPLGSFEEAVLQSTVAGAVGGVALIAEVVLGPWYRTTTAVAGPIFALMLMLWIRGLIRVAREYAQVNRVSGRDGGADRERVLIVGAGEGAQQLVTAMFVDPRSKWMPVALIDDDPLKRHRRVRGVPTVGTVSQLGAVAAQYDVRTAVVAIPSAPAALIRELSDIAAAAGIAIKVLPSANELLDPRHVAIRDVRDIDVTDLLGRHQIDTDVDSIAGYLKGKRVLITGAGGSIGAELSRQIARFGPTELFMLDRDESALHAVELSIFGEGLLEGERTVLADIRDSQVVIELFERLRPDVVFHAAALKHLPLLQRSPGEAVKTNVWGTLNVLDAAAKVGVERFVNISTDKAANPSSVLGYSKRLAEMLTAATADDTSGTFLSVRFGNVLGSRGSVLTAFTAQIATGGPVTVTDPGVTRYFMTIPEAVQLVIQAAAIGNDGEALVLDMGEPISIDSVARQLIKLSGEDVQIVYTGLRPGEKMHEDLFGSDEPDDRPRHPLISHVEVPAVDALDVRDIDVYGEPDDVIDAIVRVANRSGGPCDSVDR